MWETMIGVWELYGFVSIIVSKINPDVGPVESC